MRRFVGLRATVLAAGSLGLFLSAASPAAGSAGPSSAASQALIRAYLAGRDLPAGSVARLRADSLHTATVKGVTWAIAVFTPAATDSPAVAAEFQDGASTGIFRQTAHQAWHLVQAGPYGCGQGLPTGLDRAWGLPAPVVCQSGTGAQRRAADQARSAVGVKSGPDRTLGQSIASIALGQVGVADSPAVASFNGVDCDPYSTLDGSLSPNADGCGYAAGLSVQDENEPWCADFAKWVWQRAGVTAGLGTLNAGANSFYAWGVRNGEKLAADSGKPAVGDAVVFYPSGAISRSSYADHVGLVSAINRDGTVNLVNGDFLGTSNITVQYDTDVHLTSWAAGVWGRGEQWVLVAPPAKSQPAAPSVSISGPRVAVAGSQVTFGAQGTVKGGTVTSEQWTFGDGRGMNEAGRHVSTIFPSAGIYPVTLTVGSSLGTTATTTLDVDVTAAASTVTSAPSDAVWYSTTPVSRMLFLPGTSGLAAETSDGAGSGATGWLQQSLPGQPASTGSLAALAYQDTADADAMTAHVYFRSGSGTLTETYRDTAGWTTSALPGQPEAGSAVGAVAAAGAASGGGVTPDVFYFDAAGQLAVTTGPHWAASQLSSPVTADAGSLAAASTAAGPEVFYLGAHGRLVEAADTSSYGWRFSTFSMPDGVASGSPLAVVSAGTDQAEVFFADGHGHLAAALQSGKGWIVRELPGTTAPVALAAASDQLSGNAAGQEVFWLSRAGQPAVTAWNGRQWQTTTLHGQATGILGASAYPGSPQQLFLADGTTLRLDASSRSGWTEATLPDTAATLADRVLLYAATASDDASAQRAAAAADLPATQVTESFSTAWAATLSGNYLVIAVGQAALDALDFNECGWANPSGDSGGGTPFFLSGEPLDRLPGVDAYENGAAATSSRTPVLAAALAYYATHDALPPSATSLPGRAAPQHACAGQSS